MGMSEDQVNAEIRRNIALYIGGIGSILFTAAFLIFEAFVIKMDNLKRARVNQDVLRRESILYKKRMDELQQEKARYGQQALSESSIDDDDDPGQISQFPQPGGTGIDNFFSREAIISEKNHMEPIIFTPITHLKGDAAVKNEYVVPEITIERESLFIEDLGTPEKQRRGDSVIDFKDTLAAALQQHMQNIRRDSVSHSRRASLIDGLPAPPLPGSRRTSIVEGTGSLSQGRGSLVNSRRVSTVTSPEGVRSFHDYESLKFSNQATADDGREPPKYANVVNRSRRDSMEKQLTPNASLGYLGAASERRPSFEVAKLMEEVVPPIGSFESNFQPFGVGTTVPGGLVEALPAIPESPHPTVKQFLN